MTALSGRAAALLAVLALTVASCSSSGSSGGDPLLDQHPAARVTVRTATIPRLGTVLVDGSGHALYMFPPDAGSRVSCLGACAGVWPPLAVDSGGHASAGAGVIQADLSTLPDPNTGGRIVTYFGYPLYRYSGDVDPDEANGQALFNNGGPWYAMAPNGQPITVDPTGTS